jgi:hypothetical protein
VVICRRRGGQVQSEHAVRGSVRAGAAGRQPGRRHEAERGVHRHGPAAAPAAPPKHISAAAALRVPAPALPRQRLPPPQTPGLHLQRLWHQERGQSHSPKFLKKNHNREKIFQSCSKAIKILVLDSGYLF